MSTKPPAPRTHHATPGCYAAALADCHGRLATRDYISAPLLARLDASFEVSGLPWAPTQTTKLVTKAALEAGRPILCERHNQALEALDAMVGELFAVMTRFEAGR